MDEYISREAVLEHLNKCKEDPLFDPDMARICFAISIFIENMQAADVQPVKRGRWELTDNPSFRKCSECGAWWSSDITDNRFTNYCPKCGARLIGGEK